MSVGERKRAVAVLRQLLAAVESGELTAGGPAGAPPGAEARGGDLRARGRSAGSTPVDALTPRVAAQCHEASLSLAAFSRGQVCQSCGLGESGRMLRLAVEAHA